MRLTSPPRPASPLFALPLPFLILGMAIAYLWSWHRRPDIPERFKLDDPHEHGYPSWYGKGTTPYDRTSSSVDASTKHLDEAETDGLSDEIADGEVDKEKCDDPKNVLLYIDLPYDSPHVPHALSTYESLQQDPTVNLTVVSPLSQSQSPNGWNATWSVEGNLVGAGCSGVDVVWYVGDGRGRERAGAGRGRDVCQGPVWIDEVLGGAGAGSGRADISLLARPHDMLRSENSHEQMKEAHLADWQMGLLAHVLPAADPTIYYPSPRIQSHTAITYFPRASTPRKDYPRLPWGKGWSIYTPSRGNMPVPKIGKDAFDPKSRWRKYWEKEERRLSSAMRQAGICLFEGWHEGVFDDRMVKAMLAGCVIAGVVPQTESELLGPLMINLPRPDVSTADSPTDREQRIVDLPLPHQALIDALSHTSVNTLKHKALHAFVLARRRYTCPKRNENILGGLITVWKNGGRGYHFAHGFQWDCGGLSGTKPPWCIVGAGS